MTFGFHPNVSRSANWEFPNLVVSDLVFVFLYAEALFFAPLVCALWRPYVCALLL